MGQNDRAYAYIMNRNDEWTHHNRGRPRGILPLPNLDLEIKNYYRIFSYIVQPPTPPPPPSRGYGPGIKSFYLRPAYRLPVGSIGKGNRYSV